MSGETAGGSDLIVKPFHTALTGISFINKYFKKNSLLISLSTGLFHSTDDLWNKKARDISYGLEILLLNLFYRISIFLGISLKIFANPIKEDNSSINK